MELDRELQIIYDYICQNIDFKGKTIKIIDASIAEFLILDISFDKNIHFVLKVYLERYKNQGRFRIYAGVEKLGEPLGNTYFFRELNSESFRCIQQQIDEIISGKYNHKKTKSQKISQILENRGLASYMNQTKWQELFHILRQTLPKPIPCAIKTLFDDREENLELQNDEYLFNYSFNEIEWIAMEPKFCEKRFRGRLLEDEIIWFDFEDILLEKLKEYSIPYEEKEHVYVVYGYR